MPDLSELEGAVVGFISVHDGCTPYQVRTAMAQSHTSRFSGSSGAIYPLIRRLVARGLLAQEVRSTDGRGTRRCSLTKDGRKALRAWLVPEDMSALAGLAFDPLRTRILFLSALTSKQRLAFLAEAESVLTEELKVYLADLTLKRNGGSELEVIATEGAVAITRARRNWLRSARRHLAGTG
ncbi:MAG: PadR family transcriptional regulator [bacterium]|nr:PadR family transcriptional regulator [bacterium]